MPREENSVPVEIGTEKRSSRQAFHRPDHLRYFLEVALGSEYGLGDFTVKKWAQDLQIEIMGAPTPEDYQTLNRVVQELNEILAPYRRISISSSPGNVQLYFIPHHEFYQFEPKGIVFSGGFFWDWWRGSGEIYRARVVIASDRISQRLRNHLIREELTQVLGLMNDSMRYPESIFYQAYSEVQQFSPLDKQVIRLLYNPNVLPGMADFQVLDILKERMSSGN